MSATQTEYTSLPRMAVFKRKTQFTTGSSSQLSQHRNSSVQGVILDKFSGDTRRVGVLLAESEEGSWKGGAAVSVVDVSP